MILHVCVEAGCPTLTTKRRCPVHAKASDKARGRRQQRGYGRDHDALRAALEPNAYGKACPSCGHPMLPGQLLHLMHNVDRSGYLGMGHAWCNLSDAGKAAHG